jgi:hypothetical protein
MNAEDRVKSAMGRLPIRTLLLLAGLIGLPATPDAAGAEQLDRPASCAVVASGAPGPGHDAALLPGALIVEQQLGDHRRPLAQGPATAGPARPAPRTEVALCPARRLPGRPAGVATPLRRGPPGPALA